MVSFLNKKIVYNFGILLVIISGLMLITNQMIIINKDMIEDTQIDNIIDNKNDINYGDDYIAVLEIPKINLKKGLVAENNKNNDVDKGIQVISSDISNIESESIVLAAHSGSGYKAFFKNLDRLELEDNASVYYNGTKYNYVVTDIYTELKNGNIEIPNSNNLLILTTCYGKDEQLVVILEKDYEEVS